MTASVLKKILRRADRIVPGPLRRFVPGSLENQRLLMQRLRQEHEPSPTAPLVLFWIPGGMHLLLHVEGALATALALRGNRVHAVICDGPFRACVRREIGGDLPVRRWSEACAGCLEANREVLERLNVPFSTIGGLVPEDVREQLWTSAEGLTWENVEDLRRGGIPLGRNVRSAVLRYLQGYAYEGHEEVLREYAYTALVVAEASARALDSFAPDRVFMSHGIYADWGPAMQTALRRRVPVAAWQASYLKARIYLRHVEDGLRMSFHDMSAGAWESIRRKELSVVEEGRLEAYLERRYRSHVSHDMRGLLRKYSGQSAHFRKRYGLVEGVPVWGVLAHINWDNVSDHSPMAYQTFDELMVETVREVCGIRDVQWLVKIHPAEAKFNPESGIERLIARRFPDLPDHVRVVPALEEISPLDFYHLVDGVATVYSTGGLEMALLGKPVIVAGEAHYAGRGFTHDGFTPGSYLGLLRQASSLKPLTEAQRNLVKKYAYCYFLQRQIPLRVVEDADSEWWNFQFEKRRLLLPGNDPFVDFVCERIADGGDFIMEEGLVLEAEGLPHHALP